MAIHFKSRNGTEYSSIPIMGAACKPSELKHLIAEKKNMMGSGLDFDLTLEDAKTGTEYKDDNTMVPKNSCVIYRRVPAGRRGGIKARSNTVHAAARARYV